MRGNVSAAISAGLLMIAGVPAGAAQVPRPQEANETFRIDKARIDAALAEMVENDRAAGALALVWKDGREAYFGTSGYADREARRPVRRDTLFQIFSMTKPVTGVALMQLWEAGRFRLDDPLSLHLPEFAQTKVFAGTDASGRPILRPPSRPILIRDLMRHTAGFSYGNGPSPVDAIFDEAAPLDLQNDLVEFGRRLASVPLVSDPGMQWRYSASVDVQALLVEKLTGMAFEDYVRTRILDPLGMGETGWAQPDERFPRIAAAYVKQEDGSLTRQSDEEIRKLNFAPRRLTMGGAGLVSSADDYMRFARMLLNEGSLDGVRILKPSTVRLMATDQLDPAMTERNWLVGKGNGGFGLNFFVRTGRPLSADENRGAVGEFFWDGAWTTLFWVDPANDLAAVFLVQTAPFDGTLHRDFRRAVYGDTYVGPKGD